jgi:hypothetical protein
MFPVTPGLLPSASYAAIRTCEPLELSVRDGRGVPRVAGL